MNRLLPIALFAALAVLGCRTAAAQTFYGTTYRPPDVAYSVLETDHFEVVFQDGFEDEARESAEILERTLPPTARLVGLKRKLRMPVVLNGFNDLSNGYVTPFPFRQEVEAVSIRSGRLTPRFPTWLDVVLPHELTHAAHAELGHGGIGDLFRLFSPDLARSLNFSAPPGMAEGVAVYNESRLYPGAGRLNLSLFRMQYRAAMLSGHGWDLSQHLEPSDYARPFDRHYIAGAFLFDYLAERDSSADFFNRAATHYYQAPFLGYGVALWRGTGTAPWTLSRRLRRWGRELAQQELGGTEAPHIVAGGTGMAYRRPIWINDREVVAYGQGYHTTAGFYRIDAETGARRALAHDTITEDYIFNLSQDSAAIAFSRYVPAVYAPIKATAELYAVRLSDGHSERLTQDARLLAPVPAPGGGLWALRNDGQFVDWVHVGRGGEVDTVVDYERANIREIIPSPDGQTVLALLNVGGVQGLYKVEAGLSMPVPFLLLQNASIFDASWSADGEMLVLSADPGGIANAYSYRPETGELRRLTDARFGAIEPHLSPNGGTLAYIDYQHETYALATMPFSPGTGVLVGREVVQRGAAGLTDGLFAATKTPFDSTSVRPYRATEHLRPRTLFPVLAFEGGGSEGPAALGVGAGLAGADPLQRISYDASGYWMYNRPWGRVAVSSGQSVFRPTLDLYSKPLRYHRNLFGYGHQTFVYEERGVSVSSYVPLMLDADVYATTASIFAQAKFRQIGMTDYRNGRSGARTSRMTLVPAATFNYRLKRNPRDILPTSGLRVWGQADVDFWASEGVKMGRAAFARAAIYVPVWQRMSHVLRLDAGILTQNLGAFYDAYDFAPYGYEDASLGPFTFGRVGGQYVFPLLYVDDGLVLLPVYLRALYGFGTAEALFRTNNLDNNIITYGGGLGVQLRLFSNLNVDFRLAVIYKPDDRKTVFVIR